MGIGPMDGRQKIAGFRQNRLTSQQRWSDESERLFGPGMMLFSLIYQSDERTGINDYLFHAP